MICGALRSASARACSSVSGRASESDASGPPAASTTSGSTITPPPPGSGRVSRVGHPLVDPLELALRHVSALDRRVDHERAARVVEHDGLADRAAARALALELERPLLPRPGQ